MTKHNKNRHIPIQHKENTALYTKNPLADRHKTQPRYVTRRVALDLGLKIIDETGQTFHKKNVRKPVSKQKTLLQDPPDDDNDDSGGN